MAKKRLAGKESCEDCLHFKGCRFDKGEVTQLEEFRTIKKGGKPVAPITGFKRDFEICSAYDNSYVESPEDEYIEKNLKKFFREKEEAYKKAQREEATQEVSN